MKLTRLLTLTLLVSALASCRHKDFCYNHPHGNIYVEVEYDDDNDPDDALIIRDRISASRILVYHQPTGEMSYGADIDRSRNQLPVSAGETYHFIAHNAGTQALSFYGRDRFHSHGVTTRECDILEPLYGSLATESDVDLGNGQRVMTTIEPIWSAVAEAVVCNIGDVVHLTALPLHCRYTFEMRNIEGLGGVVRASSFITGMSGGAILGTAELHDSPVTVAVSARVGTDGRSITGSFMCFGHNPLIDVRHRMGLFLEFANGARYKFVDGDHLDVTDQVVSAHNRRRVHIIIDGIKIPASAAPDAGFDVTVNPWTGGENMDIEYEF